MLVRTNRKQGWIISLVVIASIWFGMLTGVSFLATPAKFLAPSLSLPVALDIGRQTFTVFNRIELLLIVVLAGIAVIGTRHWLTLTAIAAVATLVIAETLWLLPLLDNRVGIIIAGQQPGPSRLHTAYVVFEVMKLFGLLVVMIDGARHLAADSPMS